MAPRIAPLPFDDVPDDLKPQIEFATKATGGAVNLFLTFARHPGLLRKFLPFAGKVLGGAKLPARERELMILRTGWLCRSDYEWGQHVRIGRQAGLSDEEIQRVPHGPDHPDWSVLDASHLRACDELVSSYRIGDATWAALAEVYDTRQQLELPVLIGNYVMVAGMLNTYGVEREPGVDALPPAP